MRYSLVTPTGLDFLPATPYSYDPTPLEDIAQALLWQMPLDQDLIRVEHDGQAYWMCVPQHGWSA